MMKVWLPSQSHGRRTFSLRLAGGVLGIAVLGSLLAVGGSVWVVRQEQPKEVSLLVLCLVVSALLVWLAVRLGRGFAREVTVFFLDDQNRLFWADVRRSIPFRHLFRIRAQVSLQRQLEQIRDSRQVPPGALEILKVESMRENRNDYAVRCQVRRGGRVGRATCILMKGYEDEDWLVRELERRKIGENRWELPGEERSRFAIGLALLALLVGACLCVFSHSAVGILPFSVYFPALGLAAMGLVALVYFGVRHRRGE